VPKRDVGELIDVRVMPSVSSVTRRCHLQPIDDTNGPHT
jgi:hypothetical protein